ncbi:hypothetical protein [Acidomonas methanolica]|uniref:hypothetical protein n=1 Tax=Acidomonas methanolica TaxID=437 RepID=UPI002119C7FF|nr:hypothetical protein [Acidomonas methanolica]MCQ9155598.1 hypothetical protein [Acidomonas methanolica]
MIRRIRTIVTATGLMTAGMAFFAGPALADPAHDMAAAGAPVGKSLTPAQLVALPDGGAPPPPHGYTEVEDSEAVLADFSATVRTHRTLGLPGNEAHQSTNIPNDAPSHFSIGNMPVKFIAPVAPPYTQNVYRTVAGSPGVQDDVLLETDGHP